MLINYFDKFNIDTLQIEEKLKIIENSKTENASYISNMLLKTLKYLFNPIEVNTDNLYKELPQTPENVEGIIIFDTVSEDDKIADYTVKTIIIGNHKTHIINEKIECINIKDYRNIKKKIQNLNKIAIAFNLENIDFSKYYYNKMRSYFLHVLNKINEISIEELKKDTENICKKILLDETNFESKYVGVALLGDPRTIPFKEIIKTYQKIIQNLEYEIKYFYISKNELNEMQKNMLNELENLIELINKKDRKEIVSNVYDIICERMLKEAHELNYCNFKDNKCITMRYTDGFPNSKENGCCANTYKDKRKNCRYLKEDYSCAICSISCRVFTCKYLQDRGIDHSLWQYSLIDCIFGKLKKQKIVFSFFTPKEEMMKKLK